MTAFLLVFYALICVGCVGSFLIDNDDLPNIAKVLMVILSPFLAPLFSGMVLGMIILAKIRKETNRE